MARGTNKLSQSFIRRSLGLAGSATYVNAGSRGVELLPGEGHLRGHGGGLHGEGRQQVGLSELPLDPGSPESRAENRVGQDTQEHRTRYAAGRTVPFGIQIPKLIKHL